MLNAGVVNGEPSCEFRARFCVFFPVLGRFPYFKNTVKYTSNFPINLNKGAKYTSRGAACRRVYRAISMAKMFAPRLNLSSKPFC
jgi:hypothetical protein